jgi:hypothetical protein
MGRYPILLAMVLLGLGILLVINGYNYANCPIPTGTTSGGVCVILDYDHVIPGFILIALGILSLVLGLFMGKRTPP